MKFIQVNARDLSNLQGLDTTTTIGVEVTTPAAAALCGMGNLDHHGQGDTSDTPSACAQALAWLSRLYTDVAAVPTAVLYTGMDADTLTALALLHLGATGHDLGSVCEHTVWAIDRIDRHGRHAVSNDTLATYGVAEIYALIHAAGRITTPDAATLLVAKAASVLQGNGAAFKREVTAHAAFLAGVADRAIVTMAALIDGRPVALVESPDFAAVQHGYQFADVVIATNPQMKGANGVPYLKRTIAVRDSNVEVDLKKVYPVLNALQPGWGGHGLIGGSPIDVDCAVPISAILAALSGQVGLQVTGQEATARFDVLGDGSYWCWDSLGAAAEVDMSSGITLWERR